MSEKVDEEKIKQELAKALTEAEILEKTLANGYAVTEKLQDAENRASLLKKQLPRGHTFYFILFCLMVLCSVFTVKMFDGFFTEMWGSPDHPYLQQFRTTSALLWKACQALLAYPYFSLVAITSSMIFICLIQRRLPCTRAAALLWVLIMANVIFLFGYFRLTLGPLI
jgi:hypothetical protein